MALCPKLVEHLDSVGYARFKHIVGIHQKQAGIGIALGICPESIKLGIEHLHPAVSHGSQSGSAHFLVGDGAGSSRTAADICSSCAVDSAVASLSTP